MSASEVRGLVNWWNDHGQKKKKKKLDAFLDFSFDHLNSNQTKGLSKQQESFNIRTSRIGKTSHLKTNKTKLSLVKK